MKLSLSWVFDHIQEPWHSLDISDLVAQLSATTAEIESFEYTTLKLADFALARVTEIKSDKVVLSCPEWKKEYTLAARKDIVIDGLFLIKKENRSMRWASLLDLGSTKEGFVPALWCAEEQLKGGWKDTLEAEDYILTLDNKSITHRPDLWGHRGFAREVAAIFDLTFLPEEEFLASKPIKHYATKAPATAQNPFTFEIIATQVCKRFAGLYMPKISSAPSIPSIAVRLARIDTRSLDAIVDATNYVMFDLGQPMHAFDANKLSKNITIRKAESHESLVLLDGEQINLHEQDLVIASGDKPQALAGIMGGQEAAVTPATTSLLIEAANFDAATIRKSAAQHKKRTESSARFEKSLDPNQNTQALLRFLKLLADLGISYQAADAIASVGPLAEETVITIGHDFIVQKIGVSVSVERVITILQRLGFGVQIHNESTYIITVPTYRCAKDVMIKEDIVEEIARFIGYSTIVPQLPEIQMQLLDHSLIFKMRVLTNHMVYAMRMQEVYNYPLYDEEFLKTLSFDPPDAVPIKNPLSENARRLVTSLIPHLLKNVEQNLHKQDTLNFFERARVWRMRTQSAIAERKVYAGIFFSHTGPYDFYTGKAYVQSLFDVLNISVSWRKPQRNLPFWMHAYQTAEIVLSQNDEIVLGLAGNIAPILQERFVHGDAFIFEFDSDVVLQAESKPLTFKPLAKYQAVSLDISMFIPKKLTVERLGQVITAADERIDMVRLHDFFEKAEWLEQRSVTMRVTVQDEHKTMTKEEIDEVLHKITSAVQREGAQIR